MGRRLAHGLALTLVAVVAACAGPSPPPATSAPPASPPDSGPPPPPTSPIAAAPTLFESMDAAPSFWRKKGNRIAPSLLPSEAGEPAASGIEEGAHCTARLTAPVGDATYFYVVLRFRHAGKTAFTAFDWQNVRDTSHFSIPRFTFVEGTSVDALLFVRMENHVAREVAQLYVDRGHRWSFVEKGVEGECLPHQRDVVRRAVDGILAEVDGMLAARAERTIDLRMDDFGMGFATNARPPTADTEIDPKPHAAAPIERALLRAAAWVGWADPRVVDRVRRLEATNEQVLARFAAAFDTTWASATDASLIVDDVKCEPVAASASAPWRCEMRFKGVADDASLVLDIFTKDYRWASFGSPHGGKSSFVFDLSGHGDNRALLRVRNYPKRPEGSTFLRIPRLL